jgi:citrate synthase
MAESLTAHQATALLGVSRATLYAYVSRGLVRSEPGTGQTRERLYAAEDVVTLVRRKEERRDPEKKVQVALQWGSPLMESELTLIRDGQLFYRGRNALELADYAPLEKVAGLLWTGKLQAVKMPLKAQLSHLPMLSGTTLLESFGHALTSAGARDLQASDARLEALPGNAARILALLFAVVERSLKLPAAPDLALHERLGRAWANGRSAETDLLRRALVLIADHELNISSFTARCVASSGASLHHAALAGLCALQGPNHGLAVEQAAHLLELAEERGAHRAITELTRRTGRLSGFGHLLYPEGDPRARALLEHMFSTFPQEPAVQAAHALSHNVEHELGNRPNVDLALATVGRLLRGPAEWGVALFALGRTVGWLAHGIEAISQRQTIRPRAKYVGPTPSGSSEI